MKTLKPLLCVLAVLALLASTANAQVTKEKKQKEAEKTTVKKPVTSERVTFILHGVDCDKCAAVLTKVLKDDGITIEGSIKPMEGKPVSIVGETLLTSDISKLASSVQAAETPDRKVNAPGLWLRVFNEDKSAKKADVTTALKKIEALDSKASKYNEKTGEIDLAFTGKTKIMLSDLMSQLKSAGLNVKAINPISPKG